MKSNKSLPTLLATIISLLLIILGTVGLIALQKPLREESQDLRKDASVAGGQVTVSASPSSGALEVKTTTIDLKANTQGIQTDGVQLVFNIITDTLGGEPTILVPASSGLQAIYANLEKTDDGYLIMVVPTPQQIGNTFSSTHPTTIAQLTLPITQNGNLEISFDPEKSKANVHGTNPVQDALNYVDALHYTVTNPSNCKKAGCHNERCIDKDLALNIAGPCGPAKPEYACLLNVACERQSDGQCDFSMTDSAQKCIDDARNNPPCTEDAKQCPDGTVLSRTGPNCEFPACPPGTGGLTVKGCNVACESNAECETDHRCYNGQCRLVTNVSSLTCQNPPDQGLSFGCNQYCADARECGYGYSCLENKCRRGDNPDDQYCRAPSSTVQASISKSCNLSCDSNADCAVNMRCFYGACRLATNPSSTTCAAVTQKTVSTLYDKTPPKGGDITNQDTTSFAPNSAQNSTTSAILATPKPSPNSITSPAPLPQEKTALDSIIAALRNSGLPVSLFPILALGAGGLLLLVVFIPKIFSGKNNKLYPTPPAPHSPTPAPLSGSVTPSSKTSPQTSASLGVLSPETKSPLTPAKPASSAFTKPPVVTAPPAASPTTPPATSTPPTMPAQRPIATSIPPMAPTSTPPKTYQPGQMTTSPSSPTKPSLSKSSMIERMQNKNIKPVAK